MKNIRFVIRILILVLIFVMSITGCDNDIDDDSVSGGKKTGLYLGIVGFNENITPKEIGLLSADNKDQFNSFINKLTMKPATGLYFAVDKAINRLKTATFPNDLVNVSIVTFTDGLDNFSIELNTKYNTRDAYRDAIQDYVVNTKINSLNINAYSIGIRGGDVIDINAFRAGLIALASNQNNVFEVSSMDEVNNTFQTIANSLYEESQSQSIRLRITGGYNDGTKIRFTFDNVTNAAASNIYIEGTYSRSGTTRLLQNVVYRGLTSSSGTVITGELSSGFVTFTFENTKNTSGKDVDTTNVQQWEYIESMTLWQPNSEFDPNEDSETIVDKKSAVIMLVLDCTSSLDTGGANGFAQMKTAANNFIDILVSGDGNSGSNNGTTYTVTFNANGGSGTPPAAMTANSGSGIILPGQSSLTRSGYTFGGWNTNAVGTGTNYTAGSSYSVTGNTTLYAKWNSSGSGTTYTVTFNANGGNGSPPAAMTASSGSGIILPEQGSLTRSGYTFGGWNTNAAGTGTNYNSKSSYTVNGNVTLYARWSSVSASYTVDLTGLDVVNVYPWSKAYEGALHISLPFPVGFNINDYTKYTIRSKFYNSGKVEIPSAYGLGQVEFLDGINVIGFEYNLNEQTINRDFSNPNTATINKNPDSIRIISSADAVAHIEIIEIKFHN